MTTRSELPSKEIKPNTEIKPLSVSNSTLPHFDRPLLDIVLVDEGEEGELDQDENKGIYVTSSEDPRSDKEIVSVLLKQTLEFEL